MMQVQIHALKTDADQLIRQIEKGLPYDAIETLIAASGLPLSTLAPLMGIPERTLARRKASGKLKPNESERLVRITRIFEQSVDLFEGDSAAAVRWLTSPNRALSGDTPLNYARTELGAREVENLIGRLEHGVFS